MAPDPRGHRAGRRPAPRRDADPATPGGDGEAAFSEPWEVRAFAMAVAAYHNGQYEWSEFQLSLVNSIKTWENGGRGQRALDLLRALAGSAGDGARRQRSALRGALDEKTKAVLATPKNANHHEAHREPIAIDPAR